MAKKAYVGVNNVAKQAKKIYVGVNNIARRVKKGYIGVAGVAKLFFTSHLDLVPYLDYSTITGLYAHIESAYNGKYGFIGESDRSGHTTDVEAFDSAFIRTTPASLSMRPDDSAPIGQYALFLTNIGSDLELAVDYYNRSQTKGSTVFTLDYNTARVATYNDTYVMSFPSHPNSSARNAYFVDSSLVCTSSDVYSILGNNCYHQTRPCVASNGAYGIIYGGLQMYANNIDYAYSTSVTAVNTSGTVTAASALSNGTGDSLGVRAGDYALCAGGDIGTSSNQYSTHTVYAYDQSLTRTAPTALSRDVNTWVWSQKSTASAGEYGIISTMFSGTSGYMNWYEVYDGSLTKQIFDAVTDKIRLVGVSVGDGAVFSASQTAKWDVFKLE